MSNLIKEILNVATSFLLEQVKDKIVIIDSLLEQVKSLSENNKKYELEFESLIKNNLTKIGLDESIFNMKETSDFSWESMQHQKDNLIISIQEIENILLEENDLNKIQEFCDSMKTSCNILDDGIKEINLTISNIKSLNNKLKLYLKISNVCEKNFDIDIIQNLSENELNSIKSIFSK